MYRNLIVCGFLCVTFGIPLAYSFSMPRKAEDIEYEAAMKKAWNEKFKDTWYVPRW